MPERCPSATRRPNGEIPWRGARAANRGKQAAAIGDGNLRCREALPPPLPPATHGEHRDPPLPGDRLQARTAGQYQCAHHEEQRRHTEPAAEEARRRRRHTTPAGGAAETEAPGVVSKLRRQTDRACSRRPVPPAWTGCECVCAFAGTTHARRCAASVPSKLVQAFCVIAGSHLQEDAPAAIVCGRDSSGTWTTSPRIRCQVRLGLCGPSRAYPRSLTNGRCAAMGRQCHVEIRLNLKESAFGLITDMWEYTIQEAVQMCNFVIFRGVTWFSRIATGVYAENR